MENIPVVNDGCDSHHVKVLALGKPNSVEIIKLALVSRLLSRDTGVGRKPDLKLLDTCPDETQHHWFRWRPEWRRG